jgi:hypothetical protein
LAGFFAPFQNDTRLEKICVNLKRKAGRLGWP